MGKELETFKKIKTEWDSEGYLLKDWMDDNDINIVENGLKRLETIENSKPSEALKSLDRIDNTLCLNNIKGKLAFGIDTEEHTDCDSVIGMTEDLETIKNALLKQQELEKEKLFFKNIHNTKVKVPLVSIFEGLSKEERFKFTEHLYYHWEEMKEALEEQNKQLTEENAELKKKLNKHCLKWENLTFSNETTYIKATLNNVVVTLECWLEGKKEWCRANFNNAPCNNLVFVHHGYDDDTDTQPIIFDALGFIAESDLGNYLVFPTHNGKGSINDEELD